MIETEYADCVIIHTTVRLSWPDRLRALFGKPIHCDTRTDTENVVGKVKTESRCWVETVIPNRPQGGMEESVSTP